MTRLDYTAIHSTIFAVNDQEYFTITIPHTSPEELKSCEELAWIYYRPNEEKLQIVDPYCCIESELEGFMLHLQRALNNELEINRRLFPNIGFQWNQHLGCTCETRKQRWAGSQYLCFSTAQGPETFIYTENQQIILEIIPTYPWLFGRKPKGLKKISFKEFLRTYQPYVKTVIPHERALEWLTTAQHLRAIIDRNEQQENNISSNS